MTLTEKINRVRLNPDDNWDQLSPPNLIGIQTKSFQNFLENGIREELKNISPITGYGGRLELEFLDDYYFEEPEYPFFECQMREITYSSALKVPVRLTNKETGEVVEQVALLGDIPMMSPYGTFLINGAERIIVSQFVRSPGVYFRTKPTTIVGAKLFMSTIIPNRGSWLEVESEKDDTIFANVNKLKKVPITLFLGALGFTEKEVLERVSHNDFLKITIEKYPFLSHEESLLELNKKLRPGDPVTIESAKNTLNALFFDPAKYDLSIVGRYRVNKRLENEEGSKETVLNKDDVIFLLDHFLKLIHDQGSLDDIDHLGNRRIRSVGEQLQKQLRVGLSRLERLIVEQMSLKGSEKIVPQNLINIRPLVAVLREFFGSSQLSQFMDQTNPLAEIAHKRRLSALGPGGLTKERAGFDVRDIHPSHYGRVCPIETPEGPNAGLIGPLATFAIVNEYGFIETPYRVVDNGVIKDEIHYISADEEDKFYICPWDSPLVGNKLKNEKVISKFKRDFILVEQNKIQYMGISPKQLIGVSCGLIPFLEHDDANRALMGANMQRQAVPLVRPEQAYIGTGLEKTIARDSSSVLKANEDGTVKSINSDEIVITHKTGDEVYTLQKFFRSNQNTTKSQNIIVKENEKIKKGQIIADGASTKNGELALGKNVLVAFLPWEGYNFEDAIVISKRLVKDDVFTSVHIQKYEMEVRSTKLGPEEITREIPNVSEDALLNLDENGIIRVGASVKPGNILVGKVTPKGESEPPAEEKLLRAIFGDKARDMKDTSLRVSSGETGKVIGVRIFSRETDDVLPSGVNYIVRVYIAQLRKVSIGDKMAGRHGNKGVISTILDEEDMPFLPDGTPIDILLNPLGVPSRMNVGQLFELLLGMAAHELNEYYEVQLFDEIYGDDTSIDRVESKLEEAAKKSKKRWINKTGKTYLRDGRTGVKLDRPVAVGYMYMLKLIHLVEDKIHARSTGPYSLVTQQPLGGKAQYGGQRFGEMEVWALEAYGAAHTLQEMLTVKSDDLTGRARAYEAIIKGKTLNRPGTPESFRVLLRELRSIALDIKIVSSNGIELDTR